MLVCLACPKQANITSAHADDSHHHAGLAKAAGAAGALVPGSREHVKSFTTQLKDIVMKFSTGAYRHCSPCTAAGVHRGGADEDKHNLCGEDDEKSSILMGSNCEDQSSSDQGLHHNLIHDYADSICNQFGSASLSSTSHHDLLPIGRKKRRHLRKKKSSTSKSSLSLKQLPSHPDSCDAIEELLNEHFRREERILAEEQLCSGNQGSRADHQLLEEAKFVGLGIRREMSQYGHTVEENLDDDVHVKRSRRHLKVESGGGHVEEWLAQVEPGVMITFVAMPDGSNHLKRIRFSRELFSKWQAQLWWAENNDMVRELYSVSKTEAPFKSCSSARSSSARTSTTTSSYHQHTLQNTPELQSRVGSCQASPSNTPTFRRLSKEGKQPRSPTLCSPYISQVPSSRSISVDHHDNPLFENPEFELCYNEGGKDALVLPSALWVSTLEECSQQQCREDNVLVDAGSSPCELVHQLKRVKFIN
ncbi:hypothetical protein GOP47_0011206 [Adiantum capillus-veneris]|uniref:BRX domain-containing protein n=1 Tax=Adiantum capillus-veneris TaxID=13818 RepID=A0A9D4ZF68_ADICA|nr:hypothetical protein GOP47_0011206 [Adiantum capillus-veneris]